MEDELQKQRDKAEKTALNLVTAAAKKRQSAEMKETKQRLRKAAKTRRFGENPHIGNDADDLQEEIDSAAADLERAERSESIEADAERALSTALSKIKMPSTVPLTTMTISQTTGSETAPEGVARTKLLQEALQKKKEQKSASGSAATATVSTAASMDGSPNVGLQAMITVLKRKGSIQTKKKIGGDKDAKDKDKQQMVGDVLKLGKHLLK